MRYLPSCRRTKLSVKLDTKRSASSDLYLTKLTELTGGGDGAEDHGGGSDEGKQFGKHCKILDLES